MAEVTALALLDSIAVTLKHTTKALRLLRGEAARLHELLRLSERVEAEDQRTRGFSSISRELTYKLEDAADDLLLEAAQSGGLFSAILGYQRKKKRSTKMEKDIEEFRSRVDYLAGIFKALAPGSAETDKFDLSERRLTYGIPSEEQLFGRDKDMEDLESLLLESENISSVSVVVICGMGGLGKTSLANKLCQNPKVELSFTGGVAFVHVSRNPDYQKCLEDVHRQICSNRPICRDELTLKAVLQHEVHLILREEKCLVVLDDVWPEKDLSDAIHLLFPTDHHIASKLVITTRETHVAEAAACKFGADRIHVHRLRHLTQEEGARLFLSRLRQADKKQEIAEKATKFCDGVPLAIINFLQYMESKHAPEWTTLHDKLEFHIKKSREIDRTEDSILKTLSFSYKNLPNHLKKCFMYLGTLGKHCSNINTEKLYLFWLAEGLFSECDGDGQRERFWSLLHNLGGRSMVAVQKEELPAFIGIRSCKINQLIQELSLLKCEEEGFFKVVNFGHNGELKPDSLPYRLAINMDTYEYEKHLPVSKKDEMTRIRCLLFHATKELQTNGWPEEVSTLVHFKYLRILDFEGFDFRMIKLPKDIGTLVHLRCLSFNGCVLPELPSSVGNLILLLALDLRVKSGSKIIIPDVLRKLKKLVHLFFPESFCTKHGRRLSLKGLKNLESIINFNSGMLNFEDLFLLRKLQYVTSKIEGDDHAIKCIVKGMKNSDENSLLRTSLELRNFDCYTEDKHSLFRGILSLNSLAVFCIEGHIRMLPNHSVISRNLAKIVLIGSEIVEDPMEILEQLNELIMLVLDDDAYVGKKMTCSASGFRRLKHLELLNLHNLEEWIIEGGAMPKLAKLAIKNCGELTMNPGELGFVCDDKEAKITGVHNKSKAILKNDSGTIKFE